MDMWHVFICGVYNGVGRMRQKICTREKYVMIIFAVPAPSHYINTPFPTKLTLGIPFES